MRTHPKIDGPCPTYTGTKRTNGEPCPYHCEQPAMRAQERCKMHGSKAPQNIQAAKRRLFEAIEPALAELIRISVQGQDERTRVTAIKELLERAGFGEPRKLEITSITQDAVMAEIERLEAELAQFD